jgi:2-methylisocitrate lyase-like PEP mutase family enzyme
VRAYGHADGVFVPGLPDLGAVAEVVESTPLPVNVLYQPAGPTSAELAGVGVARISTGSYLYRAALGGALSSLLAVQGKPAPPVPTYAEIAALLPPPP